MMRRNRWTAALSAALILGLFAMGAAPSLVLGFSEPYGSAGRVHSGIDLAAGAGSEIPALSAGEVVFVGRVPSTEGGTMLAVSIDAEEGRLSLMPFESVSVSAGARVQAGDTIGRLAESGDPSSAATHLHVGLRRGGLYVDPSGLLGGIVQAPADGVPANEPAAVTERPEVNSPVPHSTPVATQVSPGGLAGDVYPQGSGGAAVAKSAADAPQTSPTEVEMAPGVSIAPDVAPMSAAGRGSGGLSAPGISAFGTRRALSVPRLRLSGRELRLRRGDAIGMAAALLAVSLATTGILMTRRFVSRQALDPAVSTRLGTLLQHLRAGDTLPGLTSCSGPTAFTVPGPSAQRR